MHGRGVQVFEQILKGVPIQKRLTTTGLGVMGYGCYVSGFWFNSHLADFTFFFLTPLRVSFRLGLG